MVNRLTSFISNSEQKGDALAASVAGKVTNLLRGNAAIALASQSVSQVPLVATLQSKAGPALAGEEALSSEDADELLGKVLAAVTSKLEAAKAGQAPGGVSEFAGLAAGLLLSGIQQTMRGSDLLDAVCAEISGVLQTVIKAVEVAEEVRGSNPNVQGIEVEVLCTDAEKRFDTLCDRVKQKVEGAMGAVKGALLATEGDDGAEGE